MRLNVYPGEEVKDFGSFCIRNKPPWFGKVDNCSNACTFIDDCWGCTHINEEEKQKYLDGCD